MLLYRRSFIAVLSRRMESDNTLMEIRHCRVGVGGGAECLASNGDWAMSTDERRSGDDRRSGLGRRSGKERRSGFDTRSEEEKKKLGERRAQDRRDSADRRDRMPARRGPKTGKTGK